MPERSEGRTKKPIYVFTYDAPEPIVHYKSQPFDGYESHKSRNRQRLLCMEILSREKPYKPRACFRAEPTISDNFRSRRTLVQRSNVFYRVAACEHLAAWVFAYFFDVDNSDQSGTFSVFFEADHYRKHDLQSDVWGASSAYPVRCEAL